VSLNGLQTCPHCKALVQSTICSICGKTAFEEVAPPPPPTPRKWGDAFENNEHRKVGGAVLVILVAAAAVVFLLTRPDSRPTANSLPPPASTTTVESKPTSSEPPPSLDGGARPATGFLPGTPREVDEALSPWETPPPVDFLTGLLLDETLDYRVDIARVAELLEVFPSELSLEPLDPPELLTFDGVIDAEQVETTQPFAARSLRRPDGAEVGELWIIATGGSPAGDDYLAVARQRWSVEAAVDQFSLDVGLRLWLLGADATMNLWASHLGQDSMVLIQAPLSIDPMLLTDALRSWRRGISSIG
jgi:hypothetical protein